LGFSAYKDDRHINGIGYGFACLTALEKAKGDILAVCDGDGTYPIESLTEILDYFVSNHLDFLSCNRYPLKAGVKIPLKLQIGVNLLNLQTFFLYGIGIKDILSGMWVIRKSILPQLELSAGDWNLSPEIKINAFTNPQLKSSEYHIVQHPRYGRTKQKYLSTGLSHSTWILGRRFKFLRSLFRKP
jgi:glycosyltransferase involved in cell wall biosynthesis